MKKKILIVSQYFYPSTLSGEAESTLAMTECLKDYFDIYLIVGGKEVGETSFFAQIDFNKWTKNNAYTIYYYKNSLNSAFNIFYTFKNIHFDYIYINGIFSFVFSIFPLIIRKILRIKTQTIIAPRGMLADESLQNGKVKKEIFLKISNLVGLYKGVYWHATNSKENTIIKNKIANHRNRIFEIEDAIIDYKTNPIRLEKSKNLTKFIYVGQIGQKKNLLFSLNQLIIRKERIVFYIIGPVVENNYWKKCLDTIKKLPPNVSIIYHKQLSKQELFKLISQCHFFLYLTLYENFGHVIIESIRMGCPVITTKNTNWNQLDKYNIGWNIELPSTQKQLTKCIELQNDEYQTMRENCFKFYDLYKINTICNKSIVNIFK